MTQSVGIAGPPGQAVWYSQTSRQHHNFLYSYYSTLNARRTLRVKMPINYCSGFVFISG